VPRDGARAFLRWCFDPLILTARQSPILLALTGLLVFVIWGGLAGFGLPYLFWHERPWVQLATGTCTALLVWELAFIGYLLASRDDSWCDQNPAEGWLLRTAVPICVGLGFAPLGSIEPDLWYPFEAGLVLGSLTVVALRRFVRWLLRPGWTLDRVFNQTVSRWVPLPRFEHRLQVVYFALMLLLYALWTVASWLHIDPWLPAAIALCLSLGLVAALYGVVRFNFEHNRVFIYAAAILLFSALQYLTFGIRHRLDCVPYDERLELPANTASAAEAGLLEQTATLEAWRDRHELPPGEKPKLAVIAVSGGGLRAAIWTSSVLVELEQRMPEFPYQVRVITGASGGMVAAAHWVATLEPPGAPQAHGDHDLVAEIGRNSLDSIAVHFALPLPRDRGIALERALERNTRGALERGLRELAEGEAAGWRPSLVFSPVIVEDGREMLFSNLDLAALTVSDPWHDDEACSEIDVIVRPCSHSITGVEFFRLFPDAEPRLSTAARLSAAFPYVSPAVQIPTQPTRRLVDAGYTDPFGVALAARWIAHNHGWLREHTSGVVLIQIRDSDGGRRDLSSSANPWILRALAGVLTPGEAVVSSRRTSIAFRNDVEVATVAALFADGDHEDRPFFTTVVFALDANASLSWSLSESERQQIRAGLATDRSDASFALLERWWAP
jgi:hypothetical protein